jgi:hypothetical protein
MNNFASCAALVALFTTSTLAETTAPDPQDWYQNQYAPVWAEKPWDKLEQIWEYYSETIFVHDVDEPLATTSTRHWLMPLMRQWQADGWTGSTLAGLRMDRLNESTASFKVKWHDFYEGGHEEFSCGWYLADLRNNSWAFTQYATINCESHKL